MVRWKCKHAGSSAKLRTSERRESRAIPLRALVFVYASITSHSSLVVVAGTTNASNASETTKTRGGNAKKKTAPAVDPDTMLGTPGDHAPAKRGRKAAVTTTSHVGDKSTFSITPFLNRTMSLAPESPDSDKQDAGKKRKASEEDDDGDGKNSDEKDAEDEAEATPLAKAKAGSKKSVAASKSKLKALAPASSAKQNSKPASKRSKTAVSTLEKVAEEDEAESPKKKPVPAAAVSEPAEKSTATKESSENDPPPPPAEEDTGATYVEKKTTTTVPLGLVPKLKSSSTSGTAANKPRKSLLSFAAFTDEPDPANKKPKKRKLLGGSSSGNTSILGGGLGKTLFDEDDGDGLPSKPVPGRGLFAKRSVLGGAGSRAKGGATVTSEDGFVFSPLKKDRRAMALAQSMLGN